MIPYSIVEGRVRSPVRTIGTMTVPLVSLTLGTVPKKIDVVVGVSASAACARPSGSPCAVCARLAILTKGRFGARQAHVSTSSIDGGAAGTTGSVADQSSTVEPTKLVTTRFAIPLCRGSAGAGGVGAANVRTTSISSVDVLTARGVKTRAGLMSICGRAV